MTCSSRTSTLHLGIQLIQLQASESECRAQPTDRVSTSPHLASQTSEATGSATGFLEVQVVGGPLLHSKKNGEGYVDTPEKMAKILDGISAELVKAG